MVKSAGEYGTMEEALPMRQPVKSYRRLAVAAAGLMVLCAVVATVRHGGVALREQPSELLDDAVHVADKILSTQRFHKANTKQREASVSQILAGSHEHKSGKDMVGKIATIVADSKESYSQRMAAMKRLLDTQTDTIKGVSPKHAVSKKVVRGRKQENADNVKAIKEAQKVLVQTVLHKKAKGGSSGLHMSAKDKKVKDETENKSADPAKEADWMNKQLVTKKKAVKHAAAAKTSTASGAPETKKQKLIKWAEAHGLPAKLAENPADNQKVKDIIARMKADLMVEKIKAQFAADDDKVSDVVHTADPSAAIGANA